MKTLIKTIAASALIATFASPAFAAIADDVRAVAGTNGNINVQVNGDTVTLTGFVEDTYSRQLAEQEANSQGFDVENYLILSD